MACYHPLQGWRGRFVNPETGRRPIVFKHQQAEPSLMTAPVSVPCGQCIGCRLEKSRQWAIRCLHEASLHDDNCFLTLTYNDDHLPEDGGLRLEHIQKFFKRLRKKYSDHEIRFFQCGEYGDDYNRPHYHAAIFGFDFPDKKFFKMRNGYKLYQSDSLSKLWPYGYANIGSVTFESAAYIARYVLKKTNVSKGTPEDELEFFNSQYERIDPETGEIFDVKPEFVTMSRRPGIGKRWFDQFKSDCYPKDFITVNGRKMRPPKFYDSKLEGLDPDLHKRLKAARQHNAIHHAENNTIRRLRVRETVQTKRADKLTRNHEKEM